MVTWDFCIPMACSVIDLQLIVNGIVKKSNYKYKLQFSEDSCYYKSKKNEYDLIDYFAMCVCDMKRKRKLHCNILSGHFWVYLYLSFYCVRCVIYISRTNKKKYCIRQA